MKKSLFATFALGATLLVGSVASAADWNGLANYPEVPNSAHGAETYYFDKASAFHEVDGSRNNVFGINVVTMHNNQYGEVNLFKYIVHPSVKTVDRVTPNGESYQIEPGSNEYNMFLAAWKAVYGTDFAFPNNNAVPADLASQVKDSVDNAVNTASSDIQSHEDNAVGMQPATDSSAEDGAIAVTQE